mmetsp:Transcript_1681/g.4561  ORF Transcript_1681/g.4561 Transcript_1681/m.4561 type:complete len:388 (+) Transcript_1681:2163-3326(+)
MPSQRLPKGHQRVDEQDTGPKQAEEPDDAAPDARHRGPQEGGQVEERPRKRLREREAEAKRLCVEWRERARLARLAAAARELRLEHGQHHLPAAVDGEAHPVERREDRELARAGAAEAAAGEVASDPRKGKQADSDHGEEEAGRARDADLLEQPLAGWWGERLFVRGPPRRSPCVERGDEASKQDEAGEGEGGPAHVLPRQQQRHEAREERERDAERVVATGLVAEHARGEKDEADRGRPRAEHDHLVGVERAEVEVVHRRARAQLHREADPVKEPEAHQPTERARTRDAHRRGHLRRGGAGHRLPERHELHEALLVQPRPLPLHERLEKEADVRRRTAEGDKPHREECRRHVADAAPVSERLGGGVRLGLRVHRSDVGGGHRGCHV